MKKTSKPLAAKAVAKAVPAPADTTLTDDQMTALAQAFHDIAVEIGQVRLDAIRAGSKLTDPAIVQLQGYVYSLMTAAGNFAVQAANLTLANADQAVNEISLATQAADRALNKLQDIDKAVSVASSVIVLAMAISTKDMGQIASAAKGVVTAARVSV
jgi:hypothetical protein